MIERRSGKIVVVGSANALKGTAPRTACSAARGAQLAYVHSAGIEAHQFLKNLDFPAVRHSSPVIA
jgi:NAD(P)-dependent dehydrogenase (short-subunit alcohol dehydrogenase family)